MYHCTHAGNIPSVSFDALDRGGKIRMWETWAIPSNPQKLTDKEAVMSLLWHPLYFEKAFWERTLGQIETEELLIMLFVYVIRENER